MEPTGWREKDDRNIEQIRAYLEREKLDAFIPSKPAHIAYLSNYYDKAHINILWEELTAFLVIPKESDAFCVGATYHYVGAGRVTAPWWLKEFHPQRADHPYCVGRTIALLKEKGLAAGRIGIETNWMPARLADHLRSALPGVEFVPANYLVPQLRLIKTRREQALLKKAAETGQRAMEAYMQAVRLGATREEAELIRAKRALEYGGEWVGGVSRIAWTGGIDSTPGWWDAPARRRFEAAPRGWPATGPNAPYLVTHFETMFDYYWCDLAWSQFYGAEPDGDDVIEFGGGNKIPYREVRHEYDELRRIQREVLQGIRPGMDQFQAQKAVEDYLRSNPEAAEHRASYFIHGIGLEVHEEPVLITNRPECVPSDTAIYYMPGAVVSSEWFSRCWTVEDPFVMTETGWEPVAQLQGLIGC